MPPGKGRAARSRVIRMWLWLVLFTALLLIFGLRMTR